MSKSSKQHARKPEGMESGTSLIDPATAIAASPADIPVSLIALAEPMHGPGIGMSESITGDRFEMALNTRGRFFLVTFKPSSGEPELLCIPMERVNWWKWA
jgi:hypothetical protein